MLRMGVGADKGFWHPVSPLSFNVVGGPALGREGVPQEAKSLPGHRPSGPR